MEVKKLKKMTEEIKVNKPRVSPFIAWFTLGLILGAGVFFAWNYYTAKNSSGETSQMEQAQAQEKIKEIINQVGKLIILPEGEEPVIATINDADSLIKDQVFYKGSSNGDVVLVYQKAAKAIIYSPERNLIVNVGPIFLQDQQAQTPSKTDTVKK